MLKVFCLLSLLIGCQTVRTNEEPGEPTPQRQVPPDLLDDNPTVPPQNPQDRDMPQR